MKKRILSVLLAVIMLVSAVPMVLPTFAATENEFTEADYNALYVQNGLEMGADFFRTNQYWGGAVVQPPVGPAANTAYPWDVNGDGVVSDGETIDLTVPENRVTEDGTSRSAAFAAAQTEWVKAHNAYMNAFVWTSGSMSFLTFTRTEVKYLPYEQSPVIMHEGYVQLGTEHNENGGIGFNNDGAPANTSATTAQLIVSFDSAYTANSSDRVPLMFHNLRAAFSKPAGADAYVLNSPVSAYFGYSYYVTTCTVNGESVALGTTPVADAYYPTQAQAEAAAKALTEKDAVKVGSTNVFTATDGTTYAVNKLKVTYPSGSSVVLKQDVATTMTQILSRSEALNGDVLSIYTGTDKVYEVASNYNDLEGTWNKCSYIGYGNKQGDLRAYAFRRYSRALSDEEIVLNHAADLLKWFKLDIKAYANLSSTDRAAVAESLKEFTFESDRDAVKSVLRNECDRVAYDFLLNDLPAGEVYNTAATFVATAKQFQLSVSEVKLLPVNRRNEVYKEVNRTSGNEKILQDAIDKAVANVITAYYSQYDDPDKDKYNYKDLYVRQDELYLAIDFFDAKATDDPIYVGVSYDTWNEEYDKYSALNSELQKWAPGKSGVSRNWQEMGYPTLEAAFKAEVKKLYNVDYNSFTDAINDVRQNRVETKRENNWDSLIEKYLWKGNAIDFTPLDISDKSYPHTNVRTFGDGTLICSLNNSVMARLQGNNDHSDVTYQVVGKIAGNWQLRGFRINFAGATQVSAFTYAGLSVTGTESAPKFTASNIGENVTYPTNARPTVATAYSVDMTVSVDKTAGADVGQYYSYEWNGSKYVVTRVPEGTPGAYGPEIFPGLMNASIYMNGVEKDTIKNVPYMQNVSDALGNSGANTYYAIRIYTCTLNAAEIAQNHFADLAGLYDFDLSLYYRLSEADRASLHKELTAIELGTSKEAAVEAYERAFCDNYYYSLNAESETGVAFTALAEQYFLDVDSLLSISSATRERIYNALMNDPDVAAGASWHWLILQGKLEDLIDDTVNAHFAESIVDTLIDLKGYQLNLYGDKPGMRGVFAINENRLGLLESRYDPDEISVTLGMMLLPEANAGDRITLENGEIKLPESAIASTVAYKNGFTDEVFYMGDDAVYTIEYYPEGDDVNAAVAYVGYICIEIDGEEPVFGYSYYNGNIAEGKAFSLSDLAVYAKETEGLAHKNVQVLTNAAKDEAYVSLIAGRVDLSEYTIYVTDENAPAVAKLQAVIKEYLGVTLKEVDAAKAAGITHLLYLGNCDTVYEDSALYGVETRGNNLYLFYKDPANSAATIARFAAVLDMAYAEGCYTFAEGTSLVYHARGIEQ